MGLNRNSSTMKRTCNRQGFADVKEICYNTNEDSNLDNRIKEIDKLPLILDVNDIASVLGISKASAYELLHSKGFPTVKIGRRYVIPRAAFEKWTENPYIFLKEE